MSNEKDKFDHSKKIHADETAMKRKLGIAKAYGIGVKAPHKCEKTSPLTCGNSNCFMCGNPRKFFNEKTIQEKRFEQDVDKCQGSCDSCNCEGDDNELS